MDHLSAIATVLPIAQLGYTIATTIFQFIGDVKGAPKELEFIALDVQLAASSADDLEKLVTQHKLQRIFASENTHRNAQVLLSQCDEIFQKIEKELGLQPQLSQTSTSAPIPAKQSIDMSWSSRALWPVIKSRIRDPADQLKKLEGHMTMVFAGTSAALSVAAKFPNPAPGKDRSLVEKEWKKEFRRFYMRRKAVANPNEPAAGGQPIAPAIGTQGARVPPPLKKQVTISSDIDDMDTYTTPSANAAMARERDIFFKWKQHEEEELKRYMEDIERIRDEQERRKKAREEDLERLRVEKEKAEEEERRVNEELLKIAKANAEREREEKERNRLKEEVRREMEEEERKKNRYISDQKKAVLDHALGILDQAEIDPAIKDTVIRQLGDNWTPPTEDPGFKPWIRTIDPPAEISRKTVVATDSDTSSIQSTRQRNRRWFPAFRGFGRRKPAIVPTEAQPLFPSDSSIVSNSSEKSYVDRVELWSLGDPCMRIPVDAPRIDLDNADHVKERDNIGKKFAALPNIYKQQLKNLLDLKEEEEKGWILLQLRFIKSRRTTRFKQSYAGWIEVQALVGLDSSQSYGISTPSNLHDDGPDPPGSKFPKRPEQTHLVVTSLKPSNRTEVRDSSITIIPTRTPLSTNPDAQQVLNQAITPAQNAQQDGDGQAMLPNPTQSAQEPLIRDQAQNEGIGKEDQEQIQTDAKEVGRANGSSTNTEALALEYKIPIPPRPSILKPQSMVPGSGDRVSGGHYWIHARNIETNVLDAHSIRWSYENDDPNYIVILEYLPHALQQILLAESRGVCIAQGRNVTDTHLSSGFNNVYARESRSQFERTQHEQPHLSSAPYGDGAVSTSSARGYMPRTYSRPRNRSPDDSYTYRPSSYYDQPSSHYLRPSSYYDRQSDHYDRQPSYYGRPLSYYNRPGLGSDERMRARESVRLRDVRNGSVVIEEDADYPGFGRTIFRAGSASEEAVIERAYPFSQEGDTIVVQRILSEAAIDDLLSLSRRNRARAPILRRDRDADNYPDVPLRMMPERQRASYQDPSIRMRSPNIDDPRDDYLREPLATQKSYYPQASFNLRGRSGVTIESRMAQNSRQRSSSWERIQRPIGEFPSYPTWLQERKPQPYSLNHDDLIITSGPPRGSSSVYDMDRWNIVPYRAMGATEVTVEANGAPVHKGSVSSAGEYEVVGTEQAGAAKELDLVDEIADEIAGEYLQPVLQQRTSSSDTGEGVSTPTRTLGTAFGLFDSPISFVGSDGEAQHFPRVARPMSPRSTMSSEEPKARQPAIKSTKTSFDIAGIVEEPETPEALTEILASIRGGRSALTATVEAVNEYDVGGKEKEKGKGKEEWRGVEEGEEKSGEK